MSQSPEEIVKINWFGIELLYYVPESADHIQKVLRCDKRLYEENALVDIFSRELKGGIIIDVGANIGNHTVFFGKVLKRRVIALEPFDKAFRVLEKNIELNRLSNRVTLLPKAAGRNAGRGELQAPPESNWGQARIAATNQGAVEIIRLDDLDVRRPVALVKIDVEGMETDVLEGARRLLKRKQPVIYVEAQTALQYGSVRRILRSLGYEMVRRFNHTPTFVFVPCRTKEQRTAALFEKAEALASLEELAISQHETTRALSRLEPALTKSLELSLEAAVKQQSDMVATQVQSFADEHATHILEDLQAARREMSGEFSRGIKESQLILRKAEQLIESLSTLHDFLKDTVSELKILAATSRHAATPSLPNVDAAHGLRLRLPFEKVALEIVIHGHGVKLKAEAPQNSLDERSDGGAEGQTNTWACDQKKQMRTLSASEMLSSISPGMADRPLVLEESPSKKGWSEWVSNDEVRLERHGRLRSLSKGDWPGAIRRSINVEPGSYYRLCFAGDISDGALYAFWIVRHADSQLQLTYYNDNIAPIRFMRGTFSHERPATLKFRVPLGIGSLDFYLLMRGARANESMVVDRVTLERITPEEACRRPELASDERIIASLASIPAREVFLRDTVESLCPQVDEIRVFLNGYEQVPSFLEANAKIIIERSQQWADHGDAGKFHWAGDTTPGYRFTCDDDLIYPIDYVEHMVKALQEYEDSCAVGVHGVLLKQPVASYYGAGHRFVCALHNENKRRFSCHVLGTGTVAYRAGAIKLDRRDFQLKNMADIWFMKAAHEQRVPLVCTERPNNWLQSQRQAMPSSIYAESNAQTNSPMDTAGMQTIISRMLHPITIRPASKMKLVLAVKTYNRETYLRECLDSFIKTGSTDYEWAVVVADDGSEDGTLKYLEQLVIPHELHIIRNNRRYAAGQTNTIFELCERIGFDVCFCVDDDLVFIKPGWDHLYVNAVEKSGFSHLVYRHLGHCRNLKKRQDTDFELPEPRYDSSNTSVAYGDAHFSFGTGSLFTVTPDTITHVGFCDEVNFPIRGQWHIDYHVRCCRAGCNDEGHLYDAAHSNEYLEIQNYLTENYQCAIPWGDEYKKTVDPVELKRRHEIIRDTARVYIGPHMNGGVQRPRTVNSFFDRIYVLNLDRRPDRWKRVSDQALHFGIELHRFPAVDGRLSPQIEQYQAYSRQPRVQVPEPLRIYTSYSLYRDYPSDISRVAFLEEKYHRKAIGSPGAWGYLHTMIRILEDALEKDYERILVLDDDVLFHKRFNELFADITAQVPHNWKILQLGALQYHWEDEWIEWFSSNLYMCQGCSTGSHAVGVHRDVIPLVLHYCYRMDLPYDDGPLHKPKFMFPRQCLTFFPNLLVQDVSESDISDETNQRACMNSKGNLFRWNMEDYLHAWVANEMSQSTPAVSAQ